jgi:hypothetical protein
MELRNDGVDVSTRSSAWMIIPGFPQHFSCTATEVSEQGATLKVFGVLGIPDKFELVKSGHHKFTPLLPLLALRDLRGAAKVWPLLGAQRTNKVSQHYLPPQRLSQSGHCCPRVYVLHFRKLCLGRLYG